MAGILTNLLKTPNQAAQVYVQGSGGFPKRRHTFIVQFLRNKISNVDTSPLTYAVKSVDRPSIQPHVEELNQYNKKRQIQTGYKTNPIKISFYDSADSSALRMLSDYSKYYFGDFSQDKTSYAYDATIGNFRDNSKGFGFTGKNGGNKQADDQFYFTEIKILAFYNNTYDLYSLINPKISSFDPDDLDYSNAEIAMLNAQISYEAMLLYVNAPIAGFPSIASLDEFQNGKFNGQTIEIQGTASTPTFTFPGPPDPTIGTASNIADVADILNQNFVPTIDSGPNSNSTPDYRYFTEDSGGGIGTYGQFVFGFPLSGSQSSFTDFGAYNSDLSSGRLDTLSTENPALAIALNLTTPSLSGTSYPGSPLRNVSGAPGVDGSQYNMVSGTVLGNTSGSGNVGDIVSKALLTSAIAAQTVSATTHGLNPNYSSNQSVQPSPLSTLGTTYGIDGANVQPSISGNRKNGTLLTPAQLGAINSARPGVAQYGFNKNSITKVASPNSNMPDSNNQPKTPPYLNLQYVLLINQITRSSSTVTATFQSDLPTSIILSFLNTIVVVGNVVDPTFNGSFYVFEVDEVTKTISWNQSGNDTTSNGGSILRK